MGWLALDRAIRISRTHPTRTSRVRAWAAERDALAIQVRAHGFDESRGSYVWTYGSGEVDSALLLLPVLEFEPPDSHRVQGTIDAVRRELGAGRALLYRYRPGIDGLEGREGAFLPCSFWLVQALARLGRGEEAIELLDELIQLSNELGLLPEEIDPSSGEHLGNFPQAFSHATLVQAALAISGANRG